MAPRLVVGFRREERSWVQVPIQVIKGRSKNLSHGICLPRGLREKILWLFVFTFSLIRHPPHSINTLPLFAHPPIPIAF